ncbi:MAG TPA: TonB-dependent receptor plug domain-containing protein [Ramlibacter sp.]|nr:TonB-dependent receptor plug domain-containing protein [Ramlibacter sp.]
MTALPHTSRWTLHIVLGTVLLPVTAAHGQEPAGTLPSVVIQSTRQDLQGVANSASEGVVTSRQLRTRPVLRAGDVMESVPGLVATQHAGEGKANQYFLRGFNLDHGTDFATFVDGVPVNQPTHGHGQGYTDLYFLIPELVDSIHYRKGPYYADTGDFAAAGSARIRTVRRLDRPFALLEAGRFGYRRLVAAGSVPAGGGDLLLATERARDDGPWTVPQDLGRTTSWRAIPPALRTTASRWVWRTTRPAGHPPTRCPSAPSTPA